MNVPSPDHTSDGIVSQTQRFAWWSGARAFWWLLAAGALGGALAEASVIMGARVALARYTMFNPQGVWLAPLANALLLLVPLGLVWLVARRRSQHAAVVAAAFLASLAAVIEPAMVLGERLHPIALVVLSLGVASTIARVANAQPVMFARVTRVLTLVMLGVSVTVGAGFNIARAVREKRALAALGASADGAPNILLLVLDTVRAMSLSTYGYTRETSPFLTELAARGATFTRAISPAPWTLPSHASMFTGRYPHELSAEWSTPLDDSVPTLAERLAQQGYATFGVASNLHYCSYEFGISRGFARYRDYDISVSEMLRTSRLTHAAVRAFNSLGGREISPGRQTGGRVNERLLDLIDARGTKPFFAFANYYDAHGPYNPAAPYDTMFLGRSTRYRDPGVDTLAAPEAAELQAAYDASIRELDEYLRDLFRQLEARGLLKNTMVIVTSDHGEEFNEHGLLNHGSTLYLPSVHVPLIVVHPGVVPAQTSVASPVTLRDLPATILDAVRAPTSAQLPGESLARWWRPGAAPASTPAISSTMSPVFAELDFARNRPPNFPVSKGDMKSEIADGFRYILGGDGRGELYDMLNDPLEQRDLSGAAEHASRASTLRERLMALPSRNARR